MSFVLNPGFLLASTCTFFVIRRLLQPSKNEGLTSDFTLRVPAAQSRHDSAVKKQTSRFSLLGSATIATALLCVVIAYRGRKEECIPCLCILLLLLIMREWRDASRPATAVVDSSLRRAPNVGLAGVWIKVHSRSQPMEPAMDLLKLNGLTRTAVKLVRGVEIKLQGSTFEMAVFSVISWFRVVEKYDLSGALSTWNRRDLRRGRHQGRVEILEDGNLELHLAWPEPFAGVGKDRFCLVDSESLLVTSRITVGDTTVEHDTYYERKR